jgi:hypothetical protein
MKSKKRPEMVADHAWQFPARFRRKGFSWKGSQLAAQRLKEAVAEIKAVARKDGALAAEGAVRLIEKISPALEQVDSSSGALGSAVNRTLAELVPIIAGAEVDAEVREVWLDRLFEASAADEIPYLESLSDYWGELCATREIASAWADRLLELTRRALTPDKKFKAHFHGTCACLSALVRAERFAELEDILRPTDFWPYKRWLVKGLAAQGKRAEAIALAEASRGPWTNETDVNLLCEEMLLADGKVDEAYRRYGLYAHRAGTYLATFRAVSRKYPSKDKAEILGDLVATTPGDEGKWFATAKEAGLYNVAIDLARQSPCDPKTLARAARDFADDEPRFAQAAGLLALHWLVSGHGYEITSLDVWGAYHSTLKAAEHLGTVADAKKAITALVASGRADGFVRQVLGREVGLG